MVHLPPLPGLGSGSSFVCLPLALPATARLCPPFHAQVDLLHTALVGITDGTWATGSVCNTPPHAQPAAAVLLLFKQYGLRSGREGREDPAIARQPPQLTACTPNTAQPTVVYLFVLRFASASPASFNAPAGPGLPSHQPASPSTVLVCLGWHFTQPRVTLPTHRPPRLLVRLLPLFIISLRPKLRLSARRAAPLARAELVFINILSPYNPGPGSIAADVLPHAHLISCSMTSSSSTSNLLYRSSSERWYVAAGPAAVPAAEASGDPNDDWIAAAAAQAAAASNTSSSARCAS